MHEIPTEFLFGFLGLLILLSAFFSSSETGMMSLNPYRLRQMRKTKRSAALADNLRKRPDRLLGVILLGNNFVNILAASVFTILAERMGIGVFTSSCVLTIVILVLAEVSPKTLAALYPEKIAFPAAYILKALLFILYPFVWFINMLSNGFLRMLFIPIKKQKMHHLSIEELRTIVDETAGKVPKTHREMLLGILDLEEVTVDDIMIPRSEITGIDLNNSWKEIVNQLASTQHTFLPVFKEDLENMAGILHTRSALNLLADTSFNEKTLMNSLDSPYFVPEGTRLTTQLLNFKQNKRRFALVVNEYGDILGIITLEDILEEVIGEFTTDMATTSKDIHPQSDGTTLVDGSLTIRELNRAMNLNLPTNGPKTLSGLMIEQLQTIPEIGTCCLIANIPVEAVQVSDNKIKTLRVSPAIEKIRK